MSEEDLAALDRAVAEGRFSDRAEAVRSAVARLFGDRTDEEIEESYRRAYEDRPEEEWIGPTGLQLLVDAARRQTDRPR